MAPLAIDPRAVERYFPDLAGTTYLNTANMSVGSAPARQAYEEAIARWSAGRFDWREAEQAGELCRAIVAEIIGAGVEEIAIIPAVSTAAGLVAANLPEAKAGESIVVGEREFSSNYFPWLLLRERGYDVRTVSSPEGTPTIEGYEGAVDGGTRLIAVSAVQSSDGYRADLGALGRLAARAGAWFFVDAAQAVGAIPIDVVRDGVDFLAAPSHKFLLGSRGMGYLYIRRGLLEKLRPIFPGWKAGRVPMESFYGPAMELSPTASRFDASLAWFPALAEAAALGLFWRFGITPILERNALLAERLHEALSASCPAFRPHPAARRSTIVSLPVSDPAAVVERLQGANVIASVRAGRVRLSTHFYNTEEEIDRVAGLLTP